MNFGSKKSKIKITWVESSDCLSIASPALYWHSPDGATKWPRSSIFTRLSLIHLLTYLLTC